MTDKKEDIVDKLDETRVCGNCMFFGVTEVTQPESVYGWCYVNPPRNPEFAPYVDRSRIACRFFDRRFVERNCFGPSYVPPAPHPYSPFDTLEKERPDDEERTD